MNVLIADDDTELTEYLSAFLQSKGCTVTSVNDARQALNKSLYDEPDVILLDVEMPRGGGRTAMKNLKLMRQTSNIPVLVISGSTDPYVHHVMTTLGCSEYFPKPIDPEALYAALCRYARADRHQAGTPVSRA